MPFDTTNNEIGKLINYIQKYWHDFILQDRVALTDLPNCYDLLVCVLEGYFGILKTNIYENTKHQRLSRFLRTQSDKVLGKENLIKCKPCALRHGSN